MKVSTNGLQSFRPVLLTVTLESQQELDAFGTLFNHTDIDESLKEVGGPGTEQLYEALKNMGADISTQNKKITELLRNKYGK